MKGRGLALRRLVYLSEHFARSGEIEPALGLHFPQRRQDIVRPVDVGVHGRKTIRKAFGNETLGGQMITFVELLLGENVEYAGIAVQASRMQVNAIQAVLQAAKTQPGLLQGDAPNQSMNLIA